MAPRRQIGILDLPDEVLLVILRAVDTDPGPINIDHRAWMSVVSFKFESRLPREPEVVGNFRFTCRRFSEVGLQHQFKTLATRFDEAGLNRLRNIARYPHLATAVKKFTYLVPRLFFNDQAHIERISEAIIANGKRVPDQLIAQAKEQVSIVESKIDRETLNGAFASFTSLQHVALLSLQNQIDARFIDFMQNNVFDTALQPSRTAAYLHGVKTLGSALLSSQSPASRLSFPMIDAQTAISLRSIPSARVQSISSRLECILARFVDPVEFEASFEQLSGVIESILTCATNLVTLHIGFPRGRPASIPLADVFQNENLTRLRVISLESWRLDAVEIIDLVRRHRSMLGGLRLRGVLLKPGSRWRDVLIFLRQEAKLTWLSLSDADYAASFDGRVPTGFDITDRDSTYSNVEDDFDVADMDYDQSSGSDASAEASDQEDHNEVTTDVDSALDIPYIEPTDAELESDLENGIPDSSDLPNTDELWESISQRSEHIAPSIDNEADTNGHISGDENDFPDPPPHVATPIPKSLCTCPTLLELGDEEGAEGTTARVTAKQRAVWEEWVLRRCLKHGTSGVVVDSERSRESST
ncbi:hypothetical protein V496_08003 [Pseudogymnoascus sp. VKM F-4515 (FW-2607)]|nr:hypothetical protein V496_08003 [Pseudogymnoascus sp. VKM F-4515 (FW-2607)]